MQFLTGNSYHSQWIETLGHNLTDQFNGPLKNIELLVMLTNIELAFAL